MSEGLPIGMLEALASGIPVVATDIAGNKDILRNSTYGVLTEPGSTESLYKGIVKTIQLTQMEQNILIKNASKRVKENFSIEGMAAKTALLYKQILSENTTQRLNH